MCSGYWLEQDHGRPAQDLLANDAFLADYARTLAQGFATAVFLYNPAVIVLGGGVAQTGDRLIAALQAALTDELGSWAYLAPKVAVTTMGASGVHWGAGELARGLL